MKYYIILNVCLMTPPPAQKVKIGYWGRNIILNTVYLIWSVQQFIDLVCLLERSMVISGWPLTCDSAHSLQIYCSAIPP